MADQLISVFDYKDKIINKLIIQGKYYFIPDIFKLFGKLTAPRLLADYPLLFGEPNTVLTPLPLHTWRRRWRGFNQAQVFSETLAKNLGLETVSLLTRNRFTKTQKDLERAARQKNVANAFTYMRVKDPAPRQVVLVDDVTTTGFSLLEAAKALKRNGVEKITCLTIARD
jgi:ComF family protein